MILQVFLVNELREAAADLMKITEKLIYETSVSITAERVEYCMRLLYHEQCLLKLSARDKCL